MQIIFHVEIYQITKKSRIEKLLLSICHEYVTLAGYVPPSGKF
jgi:hypothetical protein